MTGDSTLKGGGTGDQKVRGRERHRCVKAQLTPEEKQCKGRLLAVLEENSSDQMTLDLEQWCHLGTILPPGNTWHYVVLLTGGGVLRESSWQR